MKNFEEIRLPNFEPKFDRLGKEIPVTRVVTRYNGKMYKDAPRTKEIARAQRQAAARRDS